MKSFRAFAAFLVILSSLSNAQQISTVVKILESSPSVSLVAMGSVGTSLPGTDVFSMYHNPAHLANTESMGNISFQMLPENTLWYDWHSITQRTSAATAGWNFARLLKGLPLRIGAGYMKSELVFGASSDYKYLEEVYGKGNDEYTAFGMAVGLDYYLSFQAGLTYKSIKSNMSMIQPAYSSLAYKLEKADISAMDYGLLITAPIIKLMNIPLGFNYNKDLKAMPILNFSAGYNLRNVGGEIENSVGGRNPIGRTTVLGYSVSAGILAELTERIHIDVLKIDWAVEAEDLLINKLPPRLNAPAFEYQSGIGDIDPGKNILQIKPSDKVRVHKGLRAELVEVFLLSKGSYDGGGNISNDFEGWGVRTKGVFKLLKGENKIMHFLAEHLDLRFFQCIYRNGDKSERKADSFSVNIGGLENIF